MDLSTLAETATAAYMTGVAGHAANQTDAAALSVYRRVRDYLAERRGFNQGAPLINEVDIREEILTAISENPQFATELRGLIGANSGVNIEGAGTVHGNVTLRGKYVAGRDITFGKEQ
ncbi:hypothetical protein [Streptomyces sp. CB03911]|uniref:hypothetical protein n=1 Tax=Streptomyces sp. CB03911 TaxID=1804758 RepID=UPI0018FE9A4C|nr:hypothetical protein [Streptomyces sp. CB03911]